jgi:hypothetical protein
MLGRKTKTRRAKEALDEVLLIHGSTTKITGLKKKYKKKVSNMNNKYLEKVTGLLGTVAGAAKNFARGAVADATKVSGQIKNIGIAYKANNGLFNQGTLSTVKALGNNKAIKAGAGVIAGGYLASKTMNKQSSTHKVNKYIEKIAEKWISNTKKK